MKSIAAWGATKAGAPLRPIAIERRAVGARDVEIEILYCGVCHSDVHQVRDEWGGAIFPMVPGHEILGKVVSVGAEVRKLAAGDIAAVGCMVDSCRNCSPCQGHTEQFCEAGAAFTYNGTEMDRRTPTYGGYATRVVVDEAFTLVVPKSLDPAGAAPLLCAGITTYSPLRRFGCKPGMRVGVVGLGGLGHMAVKLAASMGAEVTVLSTSPSKEVDARRLGATGFALTSKEETFKKLERSFDLIIDAVSAPHDYNAYLGLLGILGTMVVVGVPPTPTPVAAISLIGANRKLAGSLIGGIQETQEMLDYCAKANVIAEVEVIPIQKINEAYEKMVKGQVKYRFVIDMQSLKS